jgi:hypothetical protein
MLPVRAGRRALQEATLTASRIRWALLAGIYAVFLFWYGGSGDPISPEEVEEYVAIVEARKPGASSPEGSDSEVAADLRKFIETDDGQEFVMVNLNVYRDEPRYADGRKAVGSAEEVEQEYTSKIAPRLFARACHPLLMVEPAVHIGGIGDFERQDWSRVTLVRYRSRRDFVEFVLEQDYAQDVDHKWAALSRSHTMAATPRISFATVRLVPLLILVVIGLLLDRIGARSR